MQRNAKSHVVRGPHYRLLYLALAGLTFLAAGWSSLSLAATDLSSLDCDRSARHLHNLDVDPLAIEAVDLADADDAVGADDDLTDSVAPILFLTPRVASILENVFGETSRPLADVAKDTEDDDPATSPVVGTSGGPELEPPSPLYENGAILPRFQRQMYRTDI